MQLIERSDCHTLFCCAVNLTLGYSCEDQVNKLLQKIDKTVFYKIDCRMAVDHHERFQRIATLVLKFRRNKGAWHMWIPLDFEYVLVVSL